ncbi:MAG: hypothetical protein FRX49_07256 [Trebouxia sp. A1-2]|nr:MAG: hypothetical protein FRX49_07256 [Trebouxia sp. A1-2]
MAASTTIALGWALYHDRSIDAIDQEVLQKCSSGRQRKPEKRTLRQNKSGSRGHRGITEQPKGPGLSKPSGLWGIWHIWAVVLSLAACCNGDFQVAKATVSWLMGIYDPFEDINVIAATAAEHESLGLSNESSNVTNGTWGVRHLCVYCCFTFAALMASVKAVMAALSWLAGCRDFFVDDVTEESSSRSSSKPNTKTRRRNKNGRKGHSGIREVSKGLGVSNPGGLWGIRHIWVFCLFFTAYCNAMFQVARATVSWLMGIHDPFEDINVISATAAEHKSAGPSNKSPHVTGGTWGVTHLRVYCCFIFAALMASFKAVMATLSWLVGCRDFFVDDITEDSSSSSSSSSHHGTPKAPKTVDFKVSVPISVDGKTRSASIPINVSADARSGPQTLKQGPAKSGKKKSKKQNKKKGSESAGNQTRAAGDEAAKTVEKKREEEEEDINMPKVAAKSRGSRGKKRAGAAAGSSAPLSIKGTVQNGPELITGNILVRILFTALEKALLLPRWQRMDYQSSLSSLYGIIPDWMLNQYGKHPANVSPTAAFVMLDGLLGREKKTYEHMVDEFNKPGMAHSLELLCRAMVASEMVQQRGSQKLLAELKTALPAKSRQGSHPEHDNGAVVQDMCPAIVW